MYSTIVTGAFSSPMAKTSPSVRVGRHVGLRQIARGGESDGVFKQLIWLRAGDGVAIDEEGGRGIGAQLGGFIYVGLNRLGVTAVCHTGLKASLSSPRLLARSVNRVAAGKFPLLQLSLCLKQRIMHGPVTFLFAGAARGRRRRPRVWMQAVQRQVLQDVVDMSGVDLLFEQLRQRFKGVAGRRGIGSP